MDRRLDFTAPAVIDAFSGVAGNISIQVNKKGYTPLIIANHYLITYYHDSFCSGFNWRYYDDTYGNFTDIHNMEAERGLVSTLIYVIDRGDYIHTVLDHYYIESSDAYGQYHYYHDCAMVFGYNTDKRIFYVADNFNFGKFKIFEIPYEMIEKSRENCKEKVIERAYFCDSIHYDLTWTKLLSLVKSYKDGKYYGYDGENDCIVEVEQDPNEVFGLLIFEKLIEQAKQTKEGNLDVRSYHVMCNHMEIGVMLMKWLAEIDTELSAEIVGKAYIERYQKLASKMTIARNLYLKLAMKYSEGDYIRLLRIVETVRTEETDLVKEIYEYLSLVCCAIRKADKLSIT